MRGRCGSCGSDEDESDLVAVHRVYLQTDGHGQVVGEHVLEEVEAWCLPCRTMYPNRLISD